MISSVAAESLRGRVDRGLVDLAQRPLRERRERADALDLVAEELDPERLAAGGREDVDEAAADGDLAALLDPLDPLVAGERRAPRRATSIPGSSPRASRSGAGRARRRRHALGDRERRGADEAAAGEHVERAGALADEVRRRLEAGAEADAARGEQRDVLLADEPADGLGGVAGVGVLREEHEEAAAELVVERREQERQRRLGDAGARRQRRGERGQALVGAEALDERVEERTVHDERPEQPFRGRSW